jgi:hypothetical protein
MLGNMPTHRVLMYNPRVIGALTAAKHAYNLAFAAAGAEGWVAAVARPGSKRPARPAREEAR